LIHRPVAEGLLPLPGADLQLPQLAVLPPMAQALPPGQPAARRHSLVDAPASCEYSTAPVKQRIPALRQCPDCRLQSRARWHRQVTQAGEQIEALAAPEHRFGHQLAGQSGQSHALTGIALSIEYPVAEAAEVRGAAGSHGHLPAPQIVEILVR